MILSICGFVLYAIWALVPSYILIEAGLVYLSSKYYALAIPVFVCTSLYFLGHFIYPAIILILTHPINSMTVLVDENSRVKEPTSKKPKVEPVCDLDIEEVSRKLYL